MLVCAVRGKVPIHDTIIVAEKKDVHINRARVKHGGCFVTSWDNTMALEHVTIYFV